MPMRAVLGSFTKACFTNYWRYAVHIQIWTALITMLLLKVMQLKSAFGWSLSNLAAMLRMNLLTYRELWNWLDDPYGYPAAEPLEYALPLFANILDSKEVGT